MGRVIDSTDNRRREVAKRLRELEIGFMGTCIPTGEFTTNILKAIGYGNSDAMTPYGLLADLIDPTCEVESSRYEEHDYPVSWFEYELSCGHSVTWSWQTPPKYCPECGRRVNCDADHYT